MSSGVGPELLQRLLSQHGAALELFAAQWSRTPDDCVQEAFLALVRQKKTPDRILPWLYRVVRNRAVSEARSAQRRRRHESSAAELTDPWFVEDDDPGHASVVTEALRSLPDEQREVIVARIWGRMNFEEVAEVVGTSRSTAHRRYELGLSKLRERLGLTWESKDNSTTS